jgi:2-oxoglutarate ferredoxin oxidoreductase subunit alpha
MKVKSGGSIIFDSTRVKAKGQGIDIPAILSKHQGSPIMGNTALIGALCGYAGISWDVARGVMSRRLLKETEKNLLIAKDTYDITTKAFVLHPCSGGKPRPLMSGNEWIGIGLLAGGIDAYVAYPMTPSSGVLHYLASVADEAGIEVVHPESEIAVILMALGFVYAGKKAAVGTSGGGFCLMTEGLSLAGMAEIPIVLVLSQRGGPSTGLPTYTGQSDLLFACHAGQGEFPRYIVAPATPDEACLLSAKSVQIAWTYQVPAIILSDKTLSEGVYTSDVIPPKTAPVAAEPQQLCYRRYIDTPTGVSPLLFPKTPGQVIKVNSYAHDMDGITTEDPEMVILMTDKRMRKGRELSKATDISGAVYVGGVRNAEAALLCWGSVRGVCCEVADELGIRVISPVVMAPFPKNEFKYAINGVDMLILVEDSATGQVSQLIAREGYHIDKEILRYDGRPFTVEELAEKVRGILRD